MLALEVMIARLIDTEKWIIKCEFWFHQATVPIERAMWKYEIERAKALYVESREKVTYALSRDVYFTDEYKHMRDSENDEAKQRLLSTEGRCHAFVVPPFSYQDGSHEVLSAIDYPFGYRHYRRAFEALKKGKT